MRKFLGWLIVGSAFISLCIEIFVPYGEGVAFHKGFVPYQNLFIFLLWQFASGLSLHPFFLSGSIAFALWHLVILICGIGLLKSNNFLRKIFIALCTVELFLIPTVLFCIMSTKYKSEWDFVSSLIFYLSAVWPIIYLKYFKNAFNI